jgi:hypothetical protein
MVNRTRTNIRRSSRIWKCDKIKEKGDKQGRKPIEGTYHQSQQVTNQWRGGASVEAAHGELRAGLSKTTNQGTNSFQDIEQCNRGRGGGAHHRRPQNRSWTDPHHGRQPRSSQADFVGAESSGGDNFAKSEQDRHKLRLPATEEGGRSRGRGELMRG